MARHSWRWCTIAGMDILMGFALVTVAMALLWLWQLKSGRADWVDALWAGSIGALALLYAVMGDGAIEKRVLAALMAGGWSLRLAAYIVQRLATHAEEDGRYQELRENWGAQQRSKMFGFFMLQALVAWLFALPAWVIANDPSSALNGWVIAGVLLWVISLAGEALADRQLAAFRADPAHRGQVCNVGLWRYSRHPNYFFEWLVWFSYPLVAMGAPNVWLAWLLPWVMLLFLYRISGIPYNEKQNLRSKGEAYRRYQQTTSAFIPMPPKPRSGSRDADH